MSEFIKTEAQRKAIDLLSSDKKYIMLYGGSRSGKSAIIAYAMIVRALKTRCRQIACRLAFNHARMSLWNETFATVFRLAFPNVPMRENKSEFVYYFPNGSEIQVGGLDDKHRVEKILGREFSGIWFNEASQIPYSTVSMVLTRLAEKNDLKKRIWIDCNPPTKRHWVFPIFIKGLDPNTWEPKNNAHEYGCMRLNPVDNLDNIDPDYIEMLEQLPEKDRQRFLEGKFTDDASGNIYYAFDRDKHVKPVQRIATTPLMIGMDFNVNPMTATVCQVVNDKIHIIDEIYLMQSNTNEMAKTINKRYPGRWAIIPDSTGKALKTSAAGLSDHQILKDHGFKIPAVRNPFRMDRYNEVNNLLEKSRIVIDPKCVKLIRDLEQVAYKEGTNLPDTSDKTLTHISDALGYLIHHTFPIYNIAAGSNIGNITR